MDENVSALETGADDFLIKPVSVRESMARLKSVLRSYQEKDVRVVGDPSLDRESMEISIGTERKKLGPRELDLLSHLMDHSGRVFSRDELLESVWGPWEVDDHRAVDIYLLATPREDRIVPFATSVVAYPQRTRVCFRQFGRPKSRDVESRFQIAEKVLRE